MNIMPVNLMRLIRSDSKYLYPDRLKDLIAAIPVLAVNDVYKRTARSWGFAITGSKDNREHWETIFKQHPEFFREEVRTDKGEAKAYNGGAKTDKEEAKDEDDGEEEIQSNSIEKAQKTRASVYSLVLRTGISPRYDKSAKRELREDELEKLSSEDRNNLTRGPLSNDQMKMLVDLAVTLYDQALAENKDRRWLVPIAATALASFGGTVIAHIFTSSFGAVFLSYLSALIGRLNN